MANFLEKHLTDSVSPSQSEEHSRSQNNGIGKAKSVTVLLPGDVTFGDKGEVFMPNTIEMAVIKKLEKKRFKSALAGNGIHFSSEMSEEDVKKKLQDEFDILKNCRFCCASAADNRTKLNFHGERRVWDGQCIMRNVKGNSALYLLIEHEGTPREPQPSTSGLTYQQMFAPSGASSKACIAPDISDMFASNPASQQRKAAGKRKIEITAKEEKSCSSSVKQQKKDLMYVQQMQPMFGVMQPAAAMQISSRIVSQQTGNQVDSTTPAQFQYSRNNTTTLGELPQQTLPTSVVQNIPPPHGHLAGSDMRENGVQVSQQPSSKQIITMAAQGSSQQHRLSAAVVEQKKNCKPPVQRRQLEKQSYLSISVPVASLQGSSQPCLPLQPSVVPGKQGSSLAATQRPQELSHISSTAGQRHLTGKGDASHALLLNANHQGQIELPQRGKEELPSAAAHSTGGFLQEGAQKRQYDPWMIEQTTLYPAAQENVPTSEQGNSVQQTLPPPPPPPPAHKNVPVQVLNKDASSNERKRKSSPHQHQENSALELLFAISEGETSDSAIESMWEESTDSDHVTGQSGGILKEICPNKGSIKGGDRFHLILEDFVPVETELCKAIFQGCGEVYLHKGSLSTLAGETPASLQGPGKVKVTLMSSDESCWYGETEFLYTEDPPTEEEVLSKVVKDRNMWHKLFDRISSSKPSDGQASDSSGKTGPRSSSLNQSKCAWSVKQLQLLVYKAAEIDGLEFIQMIFSTSAGKVVFNSYRNSATLPEDVARANGHLALANYLQDVNSRLSKESNSHAGMEGIDWLELKHAVDGDQSLTSGTDDAQILKKCQPVGYLESDDDESDYFADDEMSPCSSPSHNNVCDSENEDHSQKFMIPSGKRTTNSHTSALRNISSHQDTDDVVATTDSEISLDGDQKELDMIGKYKSIIETLEPLSSWKIGTGNKYITEAGDRKKEHAGTAFQSVANEFDICTARALWLISTSFATSVEIRRCERDAADYRGTVFQSLGEFNRAPDCFKKALAIDSEIGDRQGKAADYRNLGTVFLSLGEHDKAKEYLELALVITSDSGDRQGLASCYRNLATVYQSLRERDKRVEFLKKVFTIGIESGDGQGEASCYRNLGTVYQSLGEYDEQKEILEKALTIKIKIFPSYDHYKVKEYLEKLEEALAITTESGDGPDFFVGDERPSSCSTRNLPCSCYYGEPKQSRLPVNENITETADRKDEDVGTDFRLIAEELQKQAARMSMLEERLQILLRPAADYRGAADRMKEVLVLSMIDSDEHDKGKEDMKKVLVIRNESGDRQGLASCYRNLGTVYQSRGKHDKAKEYLEKELIITTESGDKQGLPSCYRNVGTLFLSLYEHDKGEEYLEKALSISIENGDGQGLASCYRNLGTLFLSLDEHDKAKEFLEKALAITKSKLW